MSINIKDLDKAAVLAALYNASKPQGMGFMKYEAEPMTIQEARKHLERNTDFDYLNGRVMKVDLSRDDLDEWLFDRDNGEGAAKAAITSLIETMDANSPEIRRVHADNTISSAQRLQNKLSEKTEIDTNGAMPAVKLGYDHVKYALNEKVKKAKFINKKRR